MKLLFDLSPADKAAYEAASSPGEKIMYCLTYDCEFEKRVDGRMVFTDRAIYKICRGEVQAWWDFATLSDFSVETLFGCGAFFAKVSGHTTRLCRFVSGRNLTRYAVVIEGCNALIRDELGRRYFTPGIHRIHSLREKAGHSYWDVTTTAGRVEFIMNNPTSNIRTLEDGRVFMYDIDGNCFTIDDPKKLDKHSYKKIEIYL